MIVETARYLIRYGELPVWSSGTEKQAPCLRSRPYRIAPIVLLTPQRPELDLSATNTLEARRVRRQRNLDMVEIPEHFVTVTDELLGKGGFGAVYMADYNGRNAAAKVRSIAFIEKHNSPRLGIFVLPTTAPTPVF